MAKSKRQFIILFLALAVALTVFVGLSQTVQAAPINQAQSAGAQSLAVQPLAAKGDLQISPDTGWSKKTETVKSVQYNVFTITKNGTYTITLKNSGSSASSTSSRIVVKPGVTANITLSNVRINSGYAAAFDMSGATVDMTIKGHNELTGIVGLHVPAGSKLTINSSIMSGDNLTARGGENGAGIGGGLNESAGNITINFANLEAYGGKYAAGIGGGKGGSGGTISINDGYITTKGGFNGAGIGGGSKGKGGTLTFKNGFLFAWGYDGGAGVGGGAGGNGGLVCITGGNLKAVSICYDSGACGAGLGGGSRGDTGVVAIKGGTVISSSSSSGYGTGPTGAGIGVGSGRTGDSKGVITISSGWVWAMGDKSVALGSQNGSGTLTLPSGYWWQSYIDSSNSNTAKSGTYPGKAFKNSTKYTDVMIDASTAPIPATVAPSVTKQAKNAVYYQKQAAAPLMVTATSLDGGVLSYQWYSNSTNSTSGAKAISGATKSSYTPETKTVSNAYYFCKVTNKNLASDPGTKAVYSKSAYIRVAPDLNKKVVAIAPSSAAGMRVDIPGLSLAKGKQASLWSENGGSNQHYYLTRDVNGWYRLKNVNSNLYLTVKGGAAINGAAIVQSPLSSSKAQLFKIDRVSAGKYRLVSALDASYVIGLKGGKTTLGSLVVLSKLSNASKTQVFALAVLKQ